MRFVKQNPGDFLEIAVLKAHCAADKPEVLGIGGKLRLNRRAAAGRILCIAREDDLVVYYGYDDVDRLSGRLVEPQMKADRHRYGPAGHIACCSGGIARGAVRNAREQRSRPSSRRTKSLLGVCSVW
jgi:hypothetical protein